MSPDNIRDRFLIALAKFLGEDPVEVSPLSDVLVCEDWFLSELLKPILPSSSKVVLTLERFNQLMLACGRPLTSSHFYNYFFQSVHNIEDFEISVEKFRVKAMWLFGNFKFAYKRLGINSVPASIFDALIKRTEPKSADEFTTRDEFADIKPIPEADLSFLGYVSAQKVDDLEMALESIKSLSSPGVDRGELLKRLEQGRISKVLARESVEFPAEGSQGLDERKLSSISAMLQPVLEERRKRQFAAEKIGIQNTQRYLTLPHLDIYVATSMRSESDFVDQHRFLQALFGHSQVRDLKLRYFDPTVSFDRNRIKKGLIECLMLRRAKLTIYLAGAEDTMGKDSELAATLAQGKPVIVYVASEPRLVPVEGRKDPVDMNRRADTFKVTHPLGLQIDGRTGVAHGIVVVRTVDECAKMLRKVLLHDLSLSIEHEGGNFLLREKETNSVLRVVTDDASLSHSFWAYFKHMDPEPDI
jgi:hypothetical protein